MPDCLKRFYEEQIPSEARDWEKAYSPRRKRGSLLDVPGGSGSVTSEDPSPSLSRTATPDSASKRGDLDETESLV